MMAALCKHRLGDGLSRAQELVAYCHKVRRPDGSFPFRNNSAVVMRHAQERLSDIKAQHSGDYAEEQLGIHSGYIVYVTCIYVVHVSQFAHFFPKALCAL